MRALALILALALGPVAVAQTAKPAPAPRPATMVPLTAMQPGLRPLVPGQSLRGLPAPVSIGDPAPQCRARCGAARATCDDDSCDQRWTQCLAACGKSSGR